MSALGIIFRMKKQTPLFLAVGLVFLFAAACSPKALTPDPKAQIRQAVEATIAAIPTATKAPPPTPFPSPTPFTLAGLFCEYQFCIGHPIDVSFFDVSAQKNPASPSSYSQGFLAAINGNMFIQVIWQLAPGTSDPRFLFDTMIDDATDTPSESPDVFLLQNMNVVYVNMSVNAAASLPYGGIGAWTCGDRVFAWKVYTPQADVSRGMFDEALARFTCGQ